MQTCISIEFEVGHVCTAPLSFRHSLEFFGEATEVIPTYQVLGMDGEVLNAVEDPKV